jgi:hypothetical protein
MTTTPRAPSTTYKSFAEFYSHYLNQHRHPCCRRLHFFGSLGVLFCLARLLVTMDPLWLAAALLWGYGLAWIGHFAFEKNRPASFRQPLYSFLGEWAMFRDILTGRIAF